jgi:5-enolpyruvylshikimate-3-phosphate synthase
MRIGTTSGRATVGRRQGSRRAGKETTVVGGDITVDRLDLESRQADRAISDLLGQMGVHLETGQGSVHVAASDLTAIRADLANCIDLLPTMAVLAALADGTSDFTGIERARIKESNRVAAVREGLERMGITVTDEAAALGRLKDSGLEDPEVLLRLTK